MNWINSASACGLVVMLCRLTVAVTGIDWLITGDTLRFAVAAVALPLTALPTIFVRDSRLRDAFAVVIAFLLAAHILLGMQMELYEKSMVYDKAMHVVGLGAIAGLLIAVIHSYCDRYKIELSLALLLILVFGGALSIGTLWEFFEFAIDSTGLFNAQRGLRDTMLDLIADAIGAVLAISLFVAMKWYRERKPKRRVCSRLVTLPHPSSDDLHGVRSKH